MTEAQTLLPTDPHPDAESQSEWYDEYDYRTWLRRETYPTRSSAIAFAVYAHEQHWVDVRARLAWLRPATVEEYESTDGWVSVYTCDADHPWAFQVWELR